MNEMKKIMVLLTLAILTGGQCLSLKAVEPEGETAYLYVAFVDAEPQTDLNVGALDGIRSLSFNMTEEARTLCVNAKDGNMKELDLTTVHKLYFSYHASQVETVERELGEIRLTDGLLYTPGVENGSPLTIYSVDGRLVKCLLTTDAPLVVDDLERGIYIVNVEGRTAKIVKR